MDDEDEVDILGDFNLESLLKSDSPISCYDHDQQLGLTCDYSGVSSQWLLDTNTQSVWFDRNEERFGLNSSIQAEPVDSNGWSEKEKYLLEKGLELFGQSWCRLAQYIGTKTAAEVKCLVRSGSALSWTSFAAQSTAQQCCFSEDAEIPASMEEIITVVSTARPTVEPRTKRKRETGNRGKKPRECSPESSSLSSPSWKKGGSGKARGRPKGPAKVNLIKAERPSLVELNRNAIIHRGDNEEIVRIKYEDSESSEVEIEDEPLGMRPIAPKPPSLVNCQPPPPPPAPTGGGRMEWSEMKWRAPSRYSRVIQSRLEAVQRLRPPEAELPRPGQLETCPIEEELMPEFFRETQRPRAPALRARYLKIRNHILDCWALSRPSYVTKTSVRAGLKNCGDVNLIGRVHAYLEMTGLINFGCEQCYYKNPSPSDEEKKKKALAVAENPASASLLALTPRTPTRTRRKRVWSEDEEAITGGITLEHFSVESNSTDVVFLNLPQPLEDACSIINCGTAEEIMSAVSIFDV